MIDLANHQSMFLTAFIVSALAGSIGFVLGSYVLYKVIRDAPYTLAITMLIL